MDYPTSVAPGLRGVDQLLGQIAGLERQIHPPTMESPAAGTGQRKVIQFKRSVASYVAIRLRRSIRSENDVNLSSAVLLGQWPSVGLVDL